ncbi:hypothetical protein BEL01nite_24370 [Bradyrhizobium elkanii]|nr:hypothetical protein BEL01nite_24370 [Bradyrhizobium elkanii]
MRIYDSPAAQYCFRRDDAGRESYALILPGIMPEKTGDPGRPSLSAPAPLSLEYWITRMRG